MLKIFTILATIEIVLLFFCTSCTISFQNISTHGTATDLVDQTQDTKADGKVDVKVPAI